MSAPASLAALGAALALAAADGAGPAVLDTGPLAAAAAPAAGTAPALPTAAVEPPRARPGDAVLVTVAGSPTPPEGRLAGRALHFYPDGPRRWRALAPLPTETAPGPAPLQLAAGGAPVAAGLEILPAAFRTRTLRIPPRFLEPPPAARRRMALDRAAIDAAYDRPFAPPTVSGRFLPPVEAEVTGRFGDERRYRGRSEGVHYGLDLAAPAGAPVAASNDGLVVLARDCYQSGNTVILSHGAGLFTSYLHLSRLEVRPGDRVRRGQELGRVGSTGRSTGPHLHWGVKVDGLWVDPASIERLDLAPGS